MMKRFKFGLVGILLGLFGLISFCNAGSFTYRGNVDFPGSSTSNRNLIYLTVPYQSYDNTITGLPIDVSCSISNYINNNGSVNFDYYAYVLLTNFSASSFAPYRGTLQDGSFSFSLNQGGVLQYSYFAIRLNGTYQNSLSFNWSCTFSGDSIMGGASSCPECETCPEINTGDILSGSCDTNYCVENDLCPVASNFSQLFINDIEHQSAPLINITIPYEYSWDSSVNSGQFDLVISGQNVDYEYIDNIVRTQNSKPSTEDFNNIITGLIPLFIPGLVIILFIWFVFKFIKKIF